MKPNTDDRKIGSNINCNEETASKQDVFDLSDPLVNDSTRNMTENNSFTLSQLINLLPPKYRKPLAIAIAIISMIFCFYNSCSAFIARIGVLLSPNYYTKSSISIKPHAVIYIDKSTKYRQLDEIPFDQAVSVQLNISESKLNDLTICVDGNVYAYKNNDYTMLYSDGMLSIIPNSNYWLPGIHNLNICLKSSKISSQSFMTRWDIDFSRENATLLVNPFDRKQSRGQIQIDKNQGVLLLAPAQVDYSNPSYITTPIFSNDISNYEIGIHYRVRDAIIGGFQVTLPGGLSVQVGDGNLYYSTLKVLDYYVDNNGVPCMVKNREAMHFQYPGSQVIANEVWVWFCRSGDLLTIYSGLNKNKVVKDSYINSCFLQSANRQLAIRSYGSIVEISNIIVIVH